MNSVSSRKEAVHVEEDGHYAKPTAYYKVISVKGYIYDVPRTISHFIIL